MALNPMGFRDFVSLSVLRWAYFLSRNSTSTYQFKPLFSFVCLCHRLIISCVKFIRASFSPSTFRTKRKQAGRRSSILGRGIAHQSRAPFSHLLRDCFHVGYPFNSTVCNLHWPVDLNPILHGLFQAGSTWGWHKVPAAFFSEMVKTNTIKRGTLTN